MSKLSQDYLSVVGRVYATRAEVIESLLQRAEQGRSRFTVDEMKAEIERRIKSTELSAHEKAVLADIKASTPCDAPRSIQMLNTLARHQEQREFLSTGRISVRTRFEFEMKAPTHPAPPVLQ